MRLASLGTAILLFPLLAATPSTSAALTRGPYLQMADTTSIMIVWNTDIAAAGTVRYGRVPGPGWEFEETSPSNTIQAVTLEDLIPGALYYYEIQANGQALASGPDYFFRTPPPSKSRKPFRFLAFGDSGNGSQKQRDLVEQMKVLRPAPELILGLGDLVYDNGEWENYDPHFFQPNADLVRNRMLWPSMGNHDSQTGNGAPYLANFWLPTDTGEPATPSGTELYYSFDYGETHFVSLDTQISDKAAGGAMHDWLRRDLGDADARGMRWKIIFAHHPPYTHGTHNSDFEPDLVYLRMNFAPVMDEFNVDLFVAGHSHTYERSYLVRDGAIFQGHANEYSKTGDPRGTMYVVSGAAAKDGTGPLDHPLMAYGKGKIIGTSVFDVSHDEIRGYFLQRDGRAVDLFTLRKGNDVTAPEIGDVFAPGGREVHVAFREPVDVQSALKIANYSISDGIVVQGATLLTDQRTVVLSTTAHPLAKAFTLTVNGVADRATVANVMPAARRVAYTVEPGTGIGSHDAWTFREGTSHPGSSWNSPSYVDAGWQRGVGGLGYGDGDDLTLLESMQGNYITLYARRFFPVSDASSVTGLTLKIRYDDGFVAYLNGTEIARKNVAASQNEMTMAASDHEAGDFESFDLSAFLPLLVNGSNLFAIEGHNASLFNTDFSLHPILEVDGGSSSNKPPVAVVRLDREAGNAPLSVEGTGIHSTDSDGGPVSLEWIFGDGSAGQSGTTSTHSYGSPGSYLVSLVAQDGQGAQSVRRKNIFVHDVGGAPTAVASVSGGVSGRAFQFSAEGSVDPDGGELFYHWDFGTGDVSNWFAPKYTFPGAEPHFITLTVTDDEGSQEVKEIVIGGVQAGASSKKGGGCGGGAGDSPLGGIVPLAFFLALAAGRLFSRRAAADRS